jgi:Type IV secretion system pilin/Bacterial Ig-like domain
MSSTAKKIITALTLLVGVFFVFHLTQAQVNLGLEYGNATGLAATDPRIIAGRIVQIFLGLLGVIALGLIIYAGFLWMTAAGNEEKIDQAKRTLVSAIIGLVIILSAFGIATFILNSLLQATGNGSVINNGSGGSQSGNGINGAGEVGECSVQNVYPVPNQTEVARNSAIFITFKEAVDPASVCATSAAGPCCAVANGDGSCKTPSTVNTKSVQIYQSSDSGNPLTDTQVIVTADHKTYTFRPASYLGSATEDTWYTVNLTGDVHRASDGSDVFSGTGCAGSLNWQFQVSDKIDLTPPQVSANGVFPPPDNGRDTTNSTLPVRAGWSIMVNGTPKTFLAASATIAPTIPSSPTPQASVAVDPNINSSVIVKIVALQGTGGLVAKASTTDGVGLGAPSFSGRTVAFSGKYSFSLTASRDLSSSDSGDEWTVTIKAAQPADSLTVGSNVYTFVDNSNAGNQIAVGSNIKETADNIVAVLNKQTDVTASFVSPAQVSVNAAAAGTAGNNIIISTTAADPAVLHVAQTTSGSDGSDTATVSGQPDQPMNTVIQINFNEPILPTTVVGKSADVSAIQVINADANASGVNGAACTADSQCLSNKCSATAPRQCVGNVLAGSFVISNLYQTVEFISDSQCGVNGCGEPIYCLPPNSHLIVKIDAASLAACASDSDCAVESPYTKCVNSVCQNSSGGNYPQANIASINGVTDAAFNSLDGNRNGNAQGPAGYGPASFYNENATAAVNGGNGDNYEWSFYISDVLDTSAPIVKSTSPAQGQTPALGQDININFSKLMMASTLVSGSTVINNGLTQVTHKNINLWNQASNPVGYWIQTQTIFKSDGTPSTTNAMIKHGDFGESSSYNAQAGSGVRDIHENCFKPSGDQTSCAGVSESQPSCCYGKPTAVLDASGDCP